MSIDSNPSNRSSGTNLALTLLAAAVAIFFWAQINATASQKKVVSWQMSNGDKQIENIKANAAQMKDVIEKQKDVVVQVGKLQTEYQAIFEELLGLAEDDKDPDAKAIVAKYGIARQKKPETKDEKKDDKKP